MFFLRESQKDIRYDIDVSRYFQIQCLLTTALVIILVICETLAFAKVLTSIADLVILCIAFTVVW